MTHKRPDLSVVMSCYNASLTVAEAIKSVLYQSFQNFEFIIIDDGSTDDTVGIIRTFADQDDRIKVILNIENKGLSESLNRGIQNSAAKYIVRMDADDVSMPNRLLLQFQFMQNHPEVDICGGAIIPKYEKGNVGKAIILPQEHMQIIQRIFKKPLVYHPSIIIKKEVYTELGMYDPQLRWAEDADLWYRIYTQVVWHNLPDPVLLYTVKSRVSFKIIRYNLWTKYRGMMRNGKLLSHGIYLIRDFFSLLWRMV